MKQTMMIITLLLVIVLMTATPALAQEPTPEPTPIPTITMTPTPGPAGVMDTITYGDITTAILLSAVLCVVTIGVMYLITASILLRKK
jgi:small-conductance mechanosensitive channel